jgi:hypothetical protein
MPVRVPCKATVSLHQRSALLVRRTGAADGNAAGGPRRVARAVWCARGCVLVFLVLHSAAHRTRACNIQASRASRESSRRLFWLRWTVRGAQCTIFVCTYCAGCAHSQQATVRTEACKVCRRARCVGAYAYGRRQEPVLCAARGVSAGVGPCCHAAHRAYAGPGEMHFSMSRSLDSVSRPVPTWCA